MRIRASPAKMPAATRAAKRGLGSTAGIGWTRTSSSWSWTEAMHPSSGSGGGKLTRTLFAERLQLRSQLRDLLLDPREALLEPLARGRLCGRGRGRRCGARRPPAPRSPARPRPRCPAGARSAPRAGPAGARGGPPAGARSAARAVAPSSSMSPKRCSRSVRAFSSPGVCAPRSMSTSSTAISASSRPRAPSSVWRYFIERRLDQLASVAHLRWTRRSIAPRIVFSS